MNLSINLRGTFTTVGFTDDLAKCGPLGLQDFDYLVSIHVDSKDILPPHGFIIDAVEIMNYFTTTYTNKKKVKLKYISCENMAMNAVNYFKLRLFELHKKDVAKLIIVQISGISGRFIEAKYEKLQMVNIPQGSMTQVSLF